MYKVKKLFSQRKNYLNFHGRYYAHDKFSYPTASTVFMSHLILNLDLIGPIVIYWCYSKGFHNEVNVVINAAFNMRLHPYS